MDDALCQPAADPVIELQITRDLYFRIGDILDVAAGTAANDADRDALERWRDEVDDAAIEAESAMLMTAARSRKGRAAQRAIVGDLLSNCEIAPDQASAWSDLIVASIGGSSAAPKKSGGRRPPIDGRTRH